MGMEAERFPVVSKCFRSSCGRICACSDSGNKLWRQRYAVEEWFRAEEEKIKRKRFLGDNSQISSVDFLQTRLVSTGLGLSLDDRHKASLGNSPLFSLLDDDIDGELQRQEAEMDRFIKVQVYLRIRFFPNSRASGQPTAPVRGEEGKFQLTSCI